MYAEVQVLQEEHPIPKREDQPSEGQVGWWLGHTDVVGIRRSFTRLEGWRDPFSDDARLGCQNISDKEPYHRIDMAFSGDPTDPFTLPVVQVWVDQECCRVAT